ncbi:MAG: lipopolysaccharide biosynthesis protein [Verrucomicrobia bacterium]|nr:MAG: lipopolysaccharide biosynthesis protein [Verrucomicrobiota bacterium]TAF25864.1 MAG: lipopolysaccharide biosynthesis protein [Verrucomicrobiota bacterium]
MSRSKRFVAGLFSSYAATGVNILYTLASVPLALHYLNKEEFGLWALVTQLSGYLMLLELGMGGAVARSLSDHKDHMETGMYGSILRTGGRVFVIQGIFIAIAGLILACFAPVWLDLPKHLHQSFAILMTGQAVLGGLRLSFGSLTSPLWCHQRLDLNNVSSIVSMAGGFFVLWVGFHFGWHLNSLIVATAASSFLSTFSIYVFCRRYGFYPTRQHRGHFDGQVFRDLFKFGSGLFLMNLGNQLASASQLVVISRLMGVEAATIWAIATKIFAMCHQFVARIMDSAAGSLAEMMVRQEFKGMQVRFRDLVGITAVAAVIGSSAIALCNGAFMEIWTSGRIRWSLLNNLLLAMTFFSISSTRCHLILVGVTKHIRGMKYIFLVEGGAFVLISLILVPRLGFSGMLLATLVCNAGISGFYGIIRTSSYFGVSWRRVTGWFFRPLVIMGLVTILFLLNWFLITGDVGPAAHLLWGFSLICGVVVPASWFIGVEPCLRIEIHRLAKSVISRLFNASYLKKLG